MFRSKSSSRGLLAALSVLFAVVLLTAGCGGGEDADEEPAATDAGETDGEAGEPGDGAETGEEPAGDDMADMGEPGDGAETGEEPAGDDMADVEVPVEEPMEGAVGDGSLGTVTVSPGEAVQIRSLNTISGDVAFLGLPNQRAVELAITDYGQIHGFDVDMGAGLDGLCSAEGGQSTAQQIVADADVIGVIGTSCSGAAVAAAPPITAASMVMISPSNTSPSLTSDLQGNPNANYNVGYYRTAHNDLFQGEAVARFAYHERGLASAAAIHDGDPYSEGLATAFKNAFENLGGIVTGVHGISKDDTDMVPLLTEIATSSPEALFFPIFQPAGDFLAEQILDVNGLEDVTLITADALLVDNYMKLPQSENIYFAGPRHPLRRQRQRLHRQERIRGASRLRGSMGRAAVGSFLGPRLRRHGAAAGRGPGGFRRGRRRLAGYRPCRGALIPRRGPRLQRPHRHDQLRRIRRLRLVEADCHPPRERRRHRRQQGERRLRIRSRGVLTRVCPESRSGIRPGVCLR